jgi:CRP/FNR family transcriptional regulator, cyclic AMP receptor protein
MPCERRLLRDVPLFALLDDDELDVLAKRLELHSFAARQRIYKIGDPGTNAFVVVAGSVRVSTIDEDYQDVVVDEVARGQFFGFASMLDQTAHQTNAVAVERTECLQVDRDDIATLILQKPHSGLDMLTVLGQQLHASQQLVRGRAARNPNELIESDATFGERIADAVAGFGGSWTFILTFLGTLVVYTGANIALRRSAWDPYPFILLNLFLSMLAALQAPVIMMSQNRQDTKDRLRGELDYDVNRRAAADIQALAGKMNRLLEKVDDLDDLIRSDRVG